MPNLLTLKNLTKIHFVDKGAAIGPLVLVVKRATREETPMSLEEKIQAAVAKAVKEVLVAKEGEQTPQQLLDVALSDLPDDKKAAIMAAVAALHQAMPPAASPTPAPAPADKAEGEGEDKPPVIEPAKADDANPKPEEEMAKALASVPEEFRAVIEKAIKTPVTDKLEIEIAKRKALEEEVGNLSEEVAKSQADAEFAEELKIANSFKLVPGDFKKRAAILLTLKKRDKKAYEEMVANFKSTEAMLAKSQKVNGTTRFDGDESGEDETARAQLERKAQELVDESVKKGKGEQIDFNVAFERVVKANKQLYVEMVKQERRVN